MSTPPSFLTEDMRRRAIGTESAPVTIEVEKGAILRFAQAIGDDNPVYSREVLARQTRFGGLIAPPTFLRSVRGIQLDVPFELPFHRVLDAGSDWAYFHPIRPGDRITAVGRISDITERTGRLGLMILVVTTITYYNQFDQVAATQTNTIIRY